MYFDAALVFVTNSLLLFRLVLAILWDFMEIKIIPKNTSHNKHMRREVSMGQFITMHARQKCLNSLLFIFLNGAKPKSLDGWGGPRQFSGFYGVRNLIIVIRKPLPYL